MPPTPFEDYEKQVIGVYTNEGTGRMERRVLEGVAEGMGINDPALVDEMLKTYEDTFWNNLEICPDALDLLNKLKTRGTAISVIANGERSRQIEKLQRAGLQDYFKEVTFSSDTGSKKPDSGIFQLALKKQASADTMPS